MTITVIGSGKVGASAALNCGLRELDNDVLLLDIVQGLPQGEAMDINHQLSERCRQDSDPCERCDGHCSHEPS